MRSFRKELGNSRHAFRLLFNYQLVSNFLLCRYKAKILMKTILKIKAISRLFFPTVFVLKQGFLLLLSTPYFGSLSFNAKRGSFVFLNLLIVSKLLPGVHPISLPR